MGNHHISSVLILALAMLLILPEAYWVKSIVNLRRMRFWNNPLE